jgi:hypothetical protein
MTFWYHNGSGVYEWHISCNIASERQTKDLYLEDCFFDKDTVHQLDTNRSFQISCTWVLRYLVESRIVSTRLTNIMANEMECLLTSWWLHLTSNRIVTDSLTIQIPVYIQQRIISLPVACSKNIQITIIVIGQYSQLWELMQFVSDSTPAVYCLRSFRKSATTASDVVSLRSAFEVKWGCVMFSINVVQLGMPTAALQVPGWQYKKPF